MRMMVTSKFRDKALRRMAIVLPLLTAVLFWEVITVGQTMVERFASPSAAFEWYKECARRGDTKGYVDCLTAESKKLIENTPPPEDLLKEEYKFLAEKKYNVHYSEEWAIIIFEENPQTEPPYLLRQEDNQWKIDLKGMSENIFFDENQHWYIQGKSQVIKPPEG